MDVSKHYTVKLDVENTSHPDYREKGRYLRMPKYHCMALLEPVDRHHTRVTYTIDADPGGKFPHVAVNWTAIEAQYITLKNLRKMVKKEKYILIGNCSKEKQIFSTGIK